MKSLLNRLVSFGLNPAGTLATLASAQIVKFRPAVGEALEVWRVTHDPAVRDTANYHNTQCWSPDGRHLAFTAGRLARQDDLNAQGKPIRQLNYKDGRLVTREFLDRDGNLVSTERFDAEGFITHSAGQRGYPQGQPAWKRDGATTFAEWTYERGVPVRYQSGTTEILREGSRYVIKK